MLAFYKKYWKTMFDIGLIVLTVYLIMWLFSKFYQIAAPILFAFILFYLFEPLARFLHRKGIRKSIASALSILIFTVVFFSILIGIGMIFTIQIGSLASSIPHYSRVIQQEVLQQFDVLQQQYDALPEQWTERIQEYFANAAALAGKWMSVFLQSLLSMVSSISSFFVNLVIGLILAYFLSVEIGDWKKIADEKTPNTFKKVYRFLRDDVWKGIGSYIKAQAKLIAITFVIIFVSLLLLRVEHAFSIALLSAFFDLLPLLGVSTVFLPWIVYLIIVGQYSLAIWLGVLLLAVIGIRQVLEPKIVGDSLGVSAFTMLAFMIISLSLFGIAGLILSPLLLILIKELYVQGYLRDWIRAPEDY